MFSSLIIPADIRWSACPAAISGCACLQASPCSCFPTAVAAPRAFVQFSPSRVTSHHLQEVSPDHQAFLEVIVDNNWIRSAQMGGGDFAPREHLVISLDGLVVTLGESGCFWHWQLRPERLLHITPGPGLPHHRELCISKCPSGQETPNKNL